MIVAVVMLFTACDNQPEHIYDDHSADIVGTWTCLREDFAEALVIKADGSVLSTGSIFGEEYWENVKGNIVLENGNITMTFEDGDNYEGHFDIIPGIAFSIYNAEGRRFTYEYCANDLADEIIGMWVCNDTPAEGESEMMIETFYENGKSVLTGFLPLEDGSEQVKNNETNYNVVGDLLFVTIPADKFGGDKPQYVVQKLIYSPNGTAAGDIMTLKAVVEVENQVVEGTSSWLRIKQSLDLANKSYDYSNIYVTNVKAKDAEFEFAGQTLNLATMDGRILDKMMKNLLFNVSFPSSNEIVYNYHYNGENVPMPASIVVDGNKMTIKKSESNPVYKDIDVWTFQDQDNTQMHMYMPTYAFENFLANTAVEMMAQNGELDLNDAEAVAAIYDGVANAIETINVSFIFKTAK